MILQTSGCNVEIGASTHESRPDSPVDTAVGAGQIGVDSSGVTFFATVNGLVVGSPSGKAQLLPIPKVSRALFDRTRSRIYAASEIDRRLYAWKLGDQVEIWFMPLADASVEALKLAISPSDGRIVAAAGTTLQTFDPDDGSAYHLPALRAPVADLAVLSDGRALVLDEAGNLRILYPRSDLAVELATRAHGKLGVSADAKRAFVAGSAYDTIAVVDLAPGHEDVVKTLPGSGPVSAARAAPVALAFLSPSDDPAAGGGYDYRLARIDATDLTIRSTDFAPYAPRYAISPDGRSALVDYDDTFYPAGSVLQRFDVEHGTLEPLATSLTLADSFAFAPDSKTAFGLSENELVAIDLASGDVTSTELDFPSTILNVSADGKTLFLRSNDRVCVWPIGEKKCTSFVSAP